MSLFLCNTGSKKFNNGALKNHESVMPRIMVIRSSDVDNWILHLDLGKISINFYQSMSLHINLLITRFVRALRALPRDPEGFYNKILRNFRRQMSVGKCPSAIVWSANGAFLLDAAE